MSSRSLTWRRIGVGAVAVATVAAGSPLLLSTAANAAPAARLVIAQDDGRSTAAAGTCTAFTVTPSDVFGGPSDGATITVTLQESPNSGTHDVDFCLVEGGAPFRTAPEYDNADRIGAAPASSSTQEYNPGPSITTAPTDSSTPRQGSDSADPNNPDGASNTDPATTTTATAPPNNNNPTGEDRASFTSSGNAIRFGVVGLLPGAGATIDAFVDNDGDRTRDTTGSNTDTVVAPQKTLSFTAGGRPGTPEASNAVFRVNILEDESVAAKTTASGPAVHAFRVELQNDRGDLVGGVGTVRLLPTSGPNAPSGTGSGTFSSDCTFSGNEGQPAVCTYRPTQVGTDTVMAFVNRAGAEQTFGFDNNEPRDFATATTTAPANTNAAEARTIVLTPEQATVPAGQSQDFTAAVTDASGAPVNGVSVRFDEDGPGAFQNPTASTAATSTVVMTTSGAGRTTVRFLTSTTDVGSNTITASIATAGTQCTQQGSGTTPAGTCSDSSPVTITAATASPSPSATPTAGTQEPGSRYRGLSSPVRVLDTRDNRGIRRAGEIVLDLSSRIPDANATSAVLNVTVTNGTRRGFLVAYPTGTTKPGTSNVNFETNQTQANEVVVRLSPDKKVSLFVDSASAHVIADLVGSFTASTGTGVGEVTTNAPVRAFDSRNTATPTRRGEVVVDLTGRIPNGSTDAVLNVTVTRTSARGFVTVFPTGTARPGTSNVNFEPGQTQANEVITRVGTGSNANKVSFFVDSASAALVVDVVGAVSPTADGQTFTALASPQRALDTRDNRGSRRSGNINLVLPSSVPANATGVILNVTATNGTRPGFVTVFPGGSTNPGTSNVNFPTNLTQANEVTTGLGANNDVTLFVGGANTPAAHVIVDVVGYLTD